MKKKINEFLKRNGYQVASYPDRDILRRMKMLKHYNIDAIFDVGANIGQYGIEMRRLGYDNKIISFEPLSSAFKKLKKRSHNDKNWIVNNYALGEKNKCSNINISGNSHSSSLLEILPSHIESAPKSKIIDSEEIEVRRLDSVFSTFCNHKDHIMLKIDTQGYEKNVIDGAEGSIDLIKMIQIEMSFVSLYKNDILFIDMMKYLEEMDFKLFSLENGFSNPTTGQLLQVDGIFVRA
jgi:FkbM family methyltransferase